MDRREDSVCGTEYSSEQSTSGSFHSPLYPDPYPADVTCHFRFSGSTSDSTERVQLVFDDLDLSYSLGDPTDAYLYALPPLLNCLIYLLKYCVLISRATLCAVLVMGGFTKAQKRKFFHTMKAQKVTT